MLNHTQNENQLPRRALLLGLLACLLFAFSLRSSTGAYLIGLIAIVVWNWRNSELQTPALPRSIYHSARALLLLLTLHATVTIPGSQAPLSQTLDNYLDYALLLAFIPLSVVFYQLRGYLHWVLLFPAVAVVARVLHRTDIFDLEHTLFSGSMYGFGTHHVPFGLQCALALLILINALFHTQKTTYNPAQLAVTGALFFASVLLAQAQLTSGSRSGWLSLFVGLVALFFCHYFRTKKRPTSNKRSVGIWLIALTVLAAIVSTNSATISKRLNGATGVDFSYTLDVSKLPRDQDVFFARRLHLTFFGFEKLSERPLLGHGPAAVPMLLQEDDDFRTNPHLHNTYIQTLVELGSLGALALLCPLLLLTYATAKAIKHAAGSPSSSHSRYTCLLVASAVTLALWSAMDNHMHQADYRFLTTWYAALAATLVRTSRSTLKPQ